MDRGGTDERNSVHFYYSFDVCSTNLIRRIRNTITETSVRRVESPPLYQYFLKIAFSLVHVMRPVQEKNGILFGTRCICAEYEMCRISI